MLEKNAYVLISVNGNLIYWPYPEAQEFCNFILSDSIVYLTDEEVQNGYKG